MGEMKIYKFEDLIPEIPKQTMTKHGVEWFFPKRVPHLLEICLYNKLNFFPL